MERAPPIPAEVVTHPLVRASRATIRLRAPGHRFRCGMGMAFTNVPSEGVSPIRPRIAPSVDVQKPCWSLAVRDCDDANDTTRQA